MSGSGYRELLEASREFAAIEDEMDLVASIAKGGNTPGFLEQMCTSESDVVRYFAIQHASCPPELLATVATGDTVAGVRFAAVSDERCPIGAVIAAAFDDENGAVRRVAMDMLTKRSDCPADVRVKVGLLSDRP